jgi:3-hydroxybutyryl-CoA dehydrogenase
MMTTLGMVGCGTMGRGIAQLAAQGGTTVLMFDALEDGAAKGRDAVVAMLERLAGKGKISSAAAAAAADRLVLCDALAGMAQCDVVVEAIVEDLQAKRQLFAGLETIVAPDCILATNTSSLSVTAIAAGLERPDHGDCGSTRKE